MWKFLLGPLLFGAGCIGGSIYGSDAEQVVHKSPDVTYAAVEQAIDNMSPSGTTHFDGGTPVPYELQVERTPDQRLVIDLLFDGKQAAVADLAFAPQNGGKDTLITAKIHGDRAALRTVLAGTDKARLAYAPDWMLNLTARPLLKQLADQIEQGTTADPMSGFMSQAEWESQLPPDEQKQVQEWRQYDAARPMVDPDADAKKFMSGNSSGK
jgi:hypothetical protein